MERSLGRSIRPKAVLSSALQNLLLSHLSRTKIVPPLHETFKLGSPNRFLPLPMSELQGTMAFPCLRPLISAKLVEPRHGLFRGESRHARTFAAAYAARRGLFRPFRPASREHPQRGGSPTQNALALHGRTRAGANRQGHRARRRRNRPPSAHQAQPDLYHAF